MRSLLWFQLGYRFRKWLVSGIAGVLLFAGALAVLLKDADIGPLQLSLSILLAILGLIMIVICLKRIFVKFINVYPTDLLKRQSHVSEIGDTLYKRKVLASGPKIVSIGGGTGTSTLLRGLKLYTSNITAIITVADDGGGSGVLRNDLGILPPGDIRNCLLALAETEPIMEKLLNYRFTEGSLKGQSFGNLFLAAMNGITNSFEEAVKHMADVLAVTGRVLPVTLENIDLVAELEDGTIIKGESSIGNHNKNHPGKIKCVKLNKPNAMALKQAVDSIIEADVIVLGPGSLYTSVIPNLLVNGIVDAISKSRALKIYVCNIMTQPGETEGYTVSEHIKAINAHAGKPIIDFCIVNKGKITDNIFKKYRDDGAEQVMTDFSKIKNLGIHIIEKDLVKIHNNYVRHDPEKLAKAIIDVYKVH
jgi:uncharacterized cofD-like protein